MGLDLAKRYPNLDINVITSPNLKNNFPQTEAIVTGIDAVSQDKKFMFVRDKAIARNKK